MIAFVTLKTVTTKIINLVDDSGSKYLMRLVECHSNVKLFLFSPSHFTARLTMSLIRDSFHYSQWEEKHGVDAFKVAASHSFIAVGYDIDGLQRKLCHLCCGYDSSATT
jgi:hypothetical protein